MVYVQVQCKCIKIGNQNYATSDKKTYFYLWKHKREPKGDNFTRKKNICTKKLKYLLKYPSKSDNNEQGQ